MTMLTDDVIKYYRKKASAEFLTGTQRKDISTNIKYPEDVKFYVNQLYPIYLYIYYYICDFFLIVLQY